VISIVAVVRMAFVRLALMKTDPAYSVRMGCDCVWRKGVRDLVCVERNEIMLSKNEFEFRIKPVQSAHLKSIP
jgi:hypothetical protein